MLYIKELKLLSKLFAYISQNHYGLVCAIVYVLQLSLINIPKEITGFNENHLISDSNEINIVLKNLLDASQFTKSGSSCYTESCFILYTRIIKINGINISYILKFYPNKLISSILYSVINIILLLLLLFNNMFNIMLLVF